MNRAYAVPAVSALSGFHPPTFGLGGLRAPLADAIQWTFSRLDLYDPDQMSSTHPPYQLA